MDIDTLRERLVELNTEAEDLKAKAAAEKRDLTVDEEGSLQGCLDEFDRVSSRIDQLTKLEEQGNKLRGSTGRKTQPDQTTRTVPTDDGSGDVATERLNPNGRIPAQARDPYSPKPKNGGFKSLGEMALSVAHAARKQGGFIDPRLERLATPTAGSVANEGSGAEGGYAVPTDFRTAIMSKVMGEESLISRTDTIPVTGNTLVVPKDNGTPWGTTGVRAYWGAEQGLKTQSRPALETMTLRLNKVYALVPVTDELLEDATAMDAYIRRKAAEAIDFAINLAIIQGTGSGQPLGILNSGALISVAKEGSQVADTLLGRNIAKMWSRLDASCRANAIWSVHQTVETQLAELSFPGRDGTGADEAGWGSHVYIPPGGLSSGPYATLYNKPVIPTQAANELGDQGDIILWDPTKYLTAVKSGINPKVDISIHLWFDYDITAFRFVLRMTGQPWWDTPITPRDGAVTTSAFVTLDARA